MTYKNIAVRDIITYNITNCSENWNVLSECHTFHRIYYIYSGEVYFKSDLETFQLEYNTLYIFPSNKVYEIVHNPNNPLKCMWFHVYFNYILVNNTIKIIVHENSDYYYMVKILESILKTILLSDTPVVQSLLNYSINALVAKMNYDHYFMTSQDNKLDIVAEIIHNSFHLPLSNSYLASILNLDQRYFLRIFKKAYGLTPQEYVSNYRICKACNMLLNGLLVKEVARGVGFEDTKAFSRFFKNRKGCSPSQYRLGYTKQP